MQLVRDGWIVGPTDKSYKVYLGEALTDDEKAAHRRQWMDTDGVARAIRSLGERDGKTAEQIDADLETEWSDRWAELRTQCNDRAKFYTAHLSDEQGREFYDLWQSGRIRWGYPGYPYRPLYLPGFAKLDAGTSSTEGT